MFGEIENGSGHRYYSDLAEYQLIAVRLAIAAGNEPATRKRWGDACGLLTAYGIRKDMTIFGLLDPAAALIRADAASARARVAQLQSLCLRVVRHNRPQGDLPLLATLVGNPSKTRPVCSCFPSGSSAFFGVQRSE